MLAHNTKFQISCGQALKTCSSWYIWDSNRWVITKGRAYWNWLNIGFLKDASSQKGRAYWNWLNILIWAISPSVIAVSAHQGWTLATRGYYWGWAGGLEAAAQSDQALTGLRVSHMIHRSVSFVFVEAEAKLSSNPNGRRPSGTLAGYHVVMTATYWATLCREMELRPHAVTKTERSPGEAKAS
jgi:hypothetical protein